MSDDCKTKPSDFSWEEKLKNPCDCPKPEAIVFQASVTLDISDGMLWQDVAGAPVAAWNPRGEFTDDGTNYNILTDCCKPDIVIPKAATLNFTVSELLQLISGKEVVPPPYNLTFVTGDWVLNGGNREITIAAADHNLGSSAYVSEVVNTDTGNSETGSNAAEILTLKDDGNGTFILVVVDGNEFNGIARVRA